MKGTSPTRAIRAVAVIGGLVPRLEVQRLVNSLLKGKSMTVVTVGIDLVKNVFAVHGVDATGKPVLVRPSLPRGKLLDAWFSNRAEVQTSGVTPNATRNRATML